MTPSLAERVRAIATDRLGSADVHTTPVDHHERLVWLATSPRGPVVIKADTDAERHRRELLGLRAAHRAGCPVPEVVDRIGGEVNVLILTALPGEPLTGTDDDRAWAAVGASLAELHGAEPSGELCTGAGHDADERVGAFLGYATGGVSADDPLVTAGAAWVRDRLTTPVEGVQVHGDGQPDHFLLDATRRRVVGVLDFGDAGRGDPLWDIAVLTLDQPSRAPVVLAGYGDQALSDRADTELVGSWALRCLTEIRWLAEHGDDPAPVRARLGQLVDSS